MTNRRTTPAVQNTVVVVDDEEGMARLLSSMISSMGYHPVTLTSGEAAVQYVQRNRPPAVILLDINLPGISGIEALRRIKEMSPAQSVVMISCLSDIEKVVSAIRLGAQHYLVKPFPVSALEKTLRSCMEDTTAAESRGNSRAPVPFITECAAMERIRENVERVAGTDVPVLILGESGVGKEIVARHLHNRSHRASRPLVKLNCAALPSELLESELFGYEKGAFTGASGSKPGKFEVANGGTLFLDEIGEIHTSLQAKLLHVLQDGRYFRLGSSTATDVDVRIVAATNVNIPEVLSTGKLRQDLYYRLNVFAISIPPLRERLESLPVFADYFLARFSDVPMKISPALMGLMMQYTWPGNVRELENFIRRYVILASEEVMMAELVQAMAQRQAATPLAMSVAVGTVPAVSAVPGVSGDTPAASKALRDFKREAERKAIVGALEANRWRRKEAAKVLNISYKALLYKIRDLEIS